MNARGLAALALLLVAVGLERFGYYGSRSFLSLDLVRLGGSASSVGALYSELRLISVGGILLGGLVALGAGPRATAAIGALVAAGGHLALALGAPLLLGAGLVAFGSGLLRPCPVAAAAELLAWDERGPSRPGPHRFAAVAAFAVLAYAAVNLGSLLGPVVAGTLRTASGPAPVYGLWAGALLIGAIAAGIAALLGPGQRKADESRRDQGPYRAPEPALAAPAPKVGLALAGLAILVVPEAIVGLGIAVADPPYSLLSSGTSSAWIYTVNPVVVVLSSLLVFALLLAATVQRSTLPPLLLYGAGLLIFALGLGLAGLAGEGSIGLVVASQAIVGVGEAATVGVPLAHAAIAARGRAATLVVAGWLTAGALLNLIENLLAGVELLRLPILGLAAFFGLCAGALLLVLGKKMHRTFFDPPLPDFRT